MYSVPLSQYLLTVCFLPAYISGHWHQHYSALGSNKQLVLPQGFGDITSTGLTYSAARKKPLDKSKLKYIEIGALFPMNGTFGWLGGQGCLPAAMMALEDVNNNEELLSGYYLNITWNNSQVSEWFQLIVLIVLVSTPAVRSRPGGYCPLRSHLHSTQEDTDSGRLLHGVLHHCGDGQNVQFGRCRLWLIVACTLGPKSIPNLFSHSPFRNHSQSDSSQVVQKVQMDANSDHNRGRGSVRHGEH